MHDFLNRMLLPTIVLACALGAYAETLDVATLQDAAIVIADSAIASEEYAAEECQRLLQEATGWRLPLQTQRRPNIPAILIGPSAVDIPTNDLGEEGLHIRIEPDTIAITGGRPRGTLYGVYEFAEKYLDIRFLTTDHTHIPDDIAQRSLPCEDHRHVPTFDFRWPFIVEINLDPVFAARLRNNRTSFAPPAEPGKLGGSSSQQLINHSFNWQLPAGTYGETHPEYFLMVDGQRRPFLRDAWIVAPNPCYAHPDVLDIVSDAAINQLKNQPSVRNVSVSATDTHAHCQCPECQAINDREESPCGSHLAFVNKVAQRVEQELPGKYVGTLAYYHTRKPPKTIKPRDNVQIQLCSIEACIIHALDDPDCPRNIAFCRDLKDWGKISENIYIWNYNTNFHYYGMPFPNFRSIGPNVRLFRDNNVKGVFMQAAGNSLTSSMSDLRNYVISRCLWKPGRSSWREMLEFCRLHYGPAAPPIIAWLTEYHDHVEAQGIHQNCFPDPDELDLTPQLALKCWRHFQNALRLAEDDEQLYARVEKASLCAYRALLEATPWQRVGDEYRLNFPDECGDVRATHQTLAAKYEVGQANERYSLDWLKRRTAPWRVVEIENDVWHLMISPDRNAAICTMLHKPAGRQLLNFIPGQGSYVRNWGLIAEGYVGIESEWPDRFAFQLTYDAEIDGNHVTMRKTLADGSLLTREIWLDDTQPEKVFCRTTLDQKGDQPRTLQIDVYPELDAGTTDFSHVRLCGETDDRWGCLRLNDTDALEQYAPVASEHDNQYAFFNTEKNFGLKVTYNPADVTRRSLWTKPHRRQLNLELRGAERTVPPNTTITQTYHFEYLTQLPR